MAGFADVLGNVAGGYTEQAQKETQRQFSSEMDRRQQLVGMLGKLAMDDTAHPEVRNNAFNMALEALHQPWNKPVKPDFNKLLVPGAGSGQNIGAAPGPVAGGTQQSTPSPAVASGQGTTTANATPQLQAPPQPPNNLYYTPEEQAGQKASLAGKVAGATAGAELKQMVPSYGADGQINMQGVSGRGEPMGKPIENAVVPQLITAQNRALIPVRVIGPDGVSAIPAIQNKATKEIFDQDGNSIPNARLFESSLVPKTTTGSSTDALGFTTTNKKTTGPSRPVAGGTTRPQLAQPPQPPGGSAQTAQQPAAGGSARPKAAAAVDIHQPSSVIRSMFNSMTPGARDVVASTMDRMMDTGVKPGEKFNKVQQAAFAALNKQGLTPPMSATEATRTKADAAKQAMSLIADARRLIQQDPSSLGPLSGRWSQLEQKYGSLEGTPKELAGTLKSLYSIAGSMHGWRAIRVADEFEKTYGGIQNTPASLMAGLNAMESTAHAVMGSVPGMDKGGQNGLQTPAKPPSGSPSGKRISRSMVDKAAKDHGIDPAMAEQQARSQGYEVY